MEWIHKVLGKIQDALGWILFVLGIVFYVLYYLDFYNILNLNGYESIFSNVGEICLVSVFVGFLLNSKSFVESIKGELEDIIYGEKFLKKRKDIAIIWEQVTKILFNDKFRGINKQLLKNIKDIYLPTSKEMFSYYQDYNQTISVNWDNEENKTIKVIYDISFTVIAENTNKFSLPLYSEVCSNKDNYKMELTNYKVDGESVQTKKTYKYDVPTKNNIEEHIIELSGKKRYDISRKITKTYSLNDDYTIMFMAVHIVNRLIVTFRYPEGLKAQFVDIGTCDGYRTTSETENFFQKENKGLILPKQGFVIALKEV